MINGFGHSLRRIAYFFVLSIIYFVSENSAFASTKLDLYSLTYSEPKLSKTEKLHILNQIELNLNTGGFEAIDTVEVKLPRLVGNGLVLHKKEDETNYVARLGLMPGVEDHVFWFECWQTTKKGRRTSKLLSQLNETVEKLCEDYLSKRDRLRISELSSDLVKLSYVDTKGALDGLTRHGIKVIREKDKLSKFVQLTDLPLVLEMSTPGPEQTSLVGQGQVTRDQSGISVLPNAASKLSKETVATPLCQLQVLYHPDQPEQFLRIKRLLSSVIDKAARQVLIEGMILEVNKDDLEELGVSWNSEAPQNIDDGLEKLEIGSTDLLTNSTLKIAVGNIGSSEWKVEVQALLASGKARVLSRPSVLTLNNRQATIRVGDDIPISTGSINNNSISTSFRYIQTGILLNVRPRVSADGTKVTIAIDTTVSSTVSGGEQVIVDPETNIELAKAPQISTRRVQTYALTASNHPLIIGGLVYHDRVEKNSKVPILGDLPLVGSLFTTRSYGDKEREMVIVLTPYVIPEDETEWPIPADSKVLDEFNGTLYRGNSRLTTNELLPFHMRMDFSGEFKKFQDKLKSMPDLEFKSKIFRNWARGIWPGDDILARKVVSESKCSGEVLDKVAWEKTFLLENNTQSGVVSLDQLLEVKGDQALAIKFAKDQKVSCSFEFVDCDSEKAWRDTMWQYKNKDIDCILVRSMGDLYKLRTAIATSVVIKRNGGEELLNAKTLKSGRLLLAPHDSEFERIVVDRNVARVFFDLSFNKIAYMKEVEKSLRLAK